MPGKTVSQYPSSKALQDANKEKFLQRKSVERKSSMGVAWEVFNLWQVLKITDSYRNELSHVAKT